MGGGSKTQTTNTSQTKDPYAPTIPALGNIITGATNAYDSGVGSQVYDGQRVAGLGSTTTAGLDSMAANASAGSGAAQAGNSYLTGLLGNGGATQTTNNALAGLMSVGTTDASGVSSAASRLSDPSSLARTTGAGLAGGAYATDTTPITGLAGNLATGGTQTERSLQDVADGRYLGGSPELDAIVNRSQNEASSTVAQQMAASGRYGSGRFAGAVADAVDNVGTNLRYTDLQNQQARQASAAGAIDSAANARASTAGGLYQGIAGINQGNAGLATTGANLSLSADQAGLAGANALAGLQGSNAAQQIGQYGTALSSAQSDRGASMAGIGLQGTNNDNLLAQGKTLAGVGAVQDAARQDAINADMSKFADQQSMPWRQLGLYSQIIDPIASAGGTTTGTETKTIPQPSLLSQVLGGVSSGVGILGQTGAFGAPTAAAGTAAASAAGASSAGWLSSALPALFALSDERLKENIKEVGQTHDGQSLYSYNFKGDPTPQIGLMAQEVAQRDPGAVAVTPSGALAVNYARATAPSAEIGARYRGLAFEGMALADSIIGAESGGNATARNPRSSATGAGQFIAGTWMDMVNRYRPDLAGLPHDQVLALRNDPTLSREMVQHYADENGAKLQAAGLPVTDGAKYLAHFAGPGGAISVMSTDPSTPISQVLHPKQVEANPFMRDWTAGQLTDWASRKVGGGAPAMTMPGASNRPAGFGFSGPSQDLAPSSRMPAGGATLTMPAADGSPDIGSLLRALAGNPAPAAPAQTTTSTAPQSPTFGSLAPTSRTPASRFDSERFFATLNRRTAR